MIRLKKHNWRDKRMSIARHRRNMKKSDIYCPECGFCCISLGPHIYWAHGVTAKDYRKLKGMTLCTRLNTEESHNKASNNTIKLRAEGKIPQIPVWEIRQGKTGYKRYVSTEEHAVKKITGKKILAKYAHLGRTSAIRKKWCDENPEKVKKRMKKMRKNLPPDYKKYLELSRHRKKHKCLIQT